MIITFKTITQQSFKIEFEPSTKVADVKKKISEEQGEVDYPADSQKLIYNGKVLQDEQTLEEVNVDEKKFVVVMVTKKKTEEPSTSSKNFSDAKKEDTAQSSTKPAESTAEKHSTVKTEQASDSNLDVPAKYADMVDMIQGMGYPRNEVIPALKAAFYDPDRCVEYLCNGIPGNAFDEPQGETFEETEGEAVQGLDFLRTNPQFQEIRDLVRANPEVLPQVVQQIAGTNPELMNAIRNNQQEFLQLINSTESDVGGVAPAGGAIGGQPPQQPGAITIAVSESDRDAIQRLKGLGFSEQLVIEAYFACDKNEDLAANYILARMDEIHDELSEGN